MLSALGTLLGTLVGPLNNMGGNMALTATNYVGNYGGTDTMSTVAVDIFTKQWIAEMGTIAIGAGTFLTSLVDFLKGLVNLL